MCFFYFRPSVLRLLRLFDLMIFVDFPIDILEVCRLMVERRGHLSLEMYDRCSLPDFSSSFFLFCLFQVLLVQCLYFRECCQDFAHHLIDLNRKIVTSMKGLVGSVMFSLSVN
jgi:hypothetical protein